MWTILDYMIIGMLIAIVSFIIKLVFNLNAKVEMVILIVLFVLIFFTDIGKEIRSKVSFFDKSNTWTDTGKNALAFQCSVATFRDFKITNFTEIEKEKLRCCIKNITINKSQDDYFQLQNTFILITDAVKSCDK